jgi:GntR family transcriptional regulator
VRDVAQSLAINPNTVLKAYRELEIEGLAQGRPGVGTFVTRTLANDSLANQADLRTEFLGWLRKAQAAGLTDEDVTSLVDTTIRAVRQADALQGNSRERTPDGARARG